MDSRDMDSWILNGGRVLALAWRDDRDLFTASRDGAIQLMRDLGHDDQPAADPGMLMMGRTRTWSIRRARRGWTS